MWVVGTLRVQIRVTVSRAAIEEAGGSTVSSASPVTKQLDPDPDDNFGSLIQTGSPVNFT